ncbi:hypothetical protein CAI21_15370 [Alkalilimnicola ehrlichii]|uniref:WD40 domain protein beta Propeller n=1 Tax=Alkalilimnicola ehrlichii TaxID=351052 RepID=A0A3E0WSN0_9GAMM|nr:PD40 domain-containing protein [Alkalilimnicola ehrlichii]RFA27225.1 hypothetical protein CAI21_15370 [Alkalilimnicola ehrlichii]RFA35399.1 hypothetical protein CAL65_13040 [Alkalilimnicola ehrlichii]
MRLLFVCGLACFMLLLGGCERAPTAEVALEGVALHGQLSYTRNRNMETFEIVIVDLASGRQRTLAVPDQIAAMDFAPDGAHLLGHVTVGETGHLVRTLTQIDLDSGSHSPLHRQHRREMYPRYSPDGSRIAYFAWIGEGTERADLYLRDADGSNPHRLDCPGKVCAHPRWHPDGDRLIYHVDDTKIVETSINDNRHTVLFQEDNLGRVLRDPFYSPGGDAAYYSWCRGSIPNVRECEIRRIDLTTGAAETVYQTRGWITYADSTGIDGIIAFSEVTRLLTEQRVHLLNEATGEVIALSDPSWSSGDPVWGP